MTDLRKAAEMALNAIDESWLFEDINRTVASALRQALAEWTPDDTAYRPDGLSQEELPPVKSYCGGKPNYCEPPPDKLPDDTEMFDNVYIRYWVQDTMESGRWATTDSMSRSTAETLLSDEYRSAFPQGEIVELPEMPVDRGAWSDVPDATKWVDELRGDKPVGYVDQSDLDREGHDFWVSRQPSKNSVPLYTAPPVDDVNTSE